MLWECKDHIMINIDDVVIMRQMGQKRRK